MKRLNNLAELYTLIAAGLREIRNNPEARIVNKEVCGGICSPLDSYLSDAATWGMFVLKKDEYETSVRWMARKLLTEAFTSWPEWSGCEAYPIPMVTTRGLGPDYKYLQLDKRKGLAMEAFKDAKRYGFAWAKETPYGAKRFELLEYLIHHFDELASES